MWWEVQSNAHRWAHSVDASLHLPSSSRSPLRSRTRTGSLRIAPPPPSSTGPISGPCSPVGFVYQCSNNSAKFQCKALGSWAMGVPADSKYHRGSQAHVSEVPGPRTMGGEGFRLWSQPTLHRTSASAHTNRSQSSVHSLDSRLWVPIMAICHGNCSPAPSPLPGAWPTCSKHDKGELSSWTHREGRGIPESCRPLLEAEGSDL